MKHLNLNFIQQVSLKKHAASFCGKKAHLHEHVWTVSYRKSSGKVEFVTCVIIFEQASSLGSSYLVNTECVSMLSANGQFQTSVSKSLFFWILFTVNSAVCQDQMWSCHLTLQVISVCAKLETKQQQTCESAQQHHP